MKIIEKVLKVMREKNIEGFYITNPYNIRYISGYTSDDAFLFLCEGNKYLITDARYTEQAANECPDFKIIDWREKERPMGETLQAIIEEEKISVLGFESRFLSVEKYNEFISIFNSNIKLVPTVGVIEKFRAIKSEYEIECHREAARIAGKAFEKILNDIKVGATEEELSLKFGNYLKLAGSTSKTSGNLLLSGARASLLHGSPSSKKIENGDFVLMDFGAIHKGYHSDISKTVVVGKPNDEQKKLYQMELKSVEMAIESIKAGISAQIPYYESMKPIEKAGYAKYHYNKIGHGLGLEMHETPMISPKTMDILEENNIVTIEPGVYMPGHCGIRIEEMILVKKDGYEILNNPSKDLIIL